MFIDNRVIVPSLRDGMPTTGPITNMTMTGGGVRFTEVIDVGTMKELILYCNVSTFTAGTLDAILQLSPDGKNFADVSTDKLTQVTGAGYQYVKITSNFGKYIRFKLTGSGSINLVASIWLSCKG